MPTKLIILIKMLSLFKGLGEGKKSVTNDLNDTANHVEHVKY